MAASASVAAERADSRLAQAFCQYGRSRSVAGAELLQKAGFIDVKARAGCSTLLTMRCMPLTLRHAQVLDGGIEAYAKVDPAVPSYPKYTPTFKF